MAQKVEITTSGNDSIVGIDCSTKLIAIVLLKNDGSFSTVDCSTKKKHFADKYEELFHKFKEIMVQYQSEIRAVFIEDVPFVQNRMVFGKLVRIVAICELVCMELGIPCFGVNVKSWKVGVIGNGNASKLQIKSYAKLAFGAIVDTLSQDFIDALVIAQYGDIRLNWHG